MSAKIFRDPLYNYISIDLDRDQWLIELLDCPEVQRLRRIHQLGVSDLTYPGASHTRFGHTLGVLHLMQRMHEHVEKLFNEESVRLCRSRLLAAAVLHDVGHGPFSHLFEPCLGIKHEVWSGRIVLNEEGRAYHVLRKVDPTLPETVAQLIDEDDYELPQWQKFLLSSQLDVDRMDYLRRDSLFTGGGYGHFDWYRLINTLEFDEGVDGQWDIVWPDKAKFAIEEYIFARYYMYQNVFLHKTTRGFEQILQAMWKRAKALFENGTDVELLQEIQAFWDSESPTVEQYLAIEEFTILQQIHQWKGHDDPVLSDLSQRFLTRDRFAMIDAPIPSHDLSDSYEQWEAALQDEVKKAGFHPPDAYCLRDQLKGKYNQPYIPEREEDEQSAKTAIRIKADDNHRPTEISQVLDRLRPVTSEPQDRYRYYVPREVRKAAEKLRREWSAQ